MSIIKGVIIAHVQAGADLSSLENLSDRYDIVRPPVGVELTFQSHPTVLAEPSEEDVGEYTEMIEKLQEALDSDETDLGLLIDEAVAYIGNLEDANAEENDGSDEVDHDEGGESEEPEEDDDDGGLIVR